MISFDCASGCESRLPEQLTDEDPAFSPGGSISTLGRLRAEMDEGKRVCVKIPCTQVTGRWDYRIA